MARKKKKIGVAMRMHLDSKGFDGQELFPTSEDKRIRLTQLKAMSSSEIKTFIIDPDQDGVPSRADWAPKNAQEQYDSDGDGIGDNEDIMFSKIRLDNLIALSGLYYGKEWTLSYAINEWKTGNGPDGNPRDGKIVNPITLNAIRDIEEDDQEIRLRIFNFGETEGEYPQFAPKWLKKPTMAGGAGQIIKWVKDVNDNLNQILNLETVEQRWEALQTAREGEGEFATSTTFLFKDSLCFYSSDWYYDEFQGGLSSKSFDLIKKIQEEILSMNPEDGAHFPEISLKKFMSALPSYDEELTAKYINQLWKYHNLGNSEFTDVWQDAYAREGAGRYIYNLVKNTNYELIFQEGLNMLKNVYNNITILENEAVEAGLIDASQIPVPAFFADLGNLGWEDFGYPTTNNCFDD